MGEGKVQGETAPGEARDIVARKRAAQARFRARRRGEDVPLLRRGGRHRPPKPSTICPECGERKDCRARTCLACRPHPQTPDEKREAMLNRFTGLALCELWAFPLPFPPGVLPHRRPHVHLYERAERDDA